MPATITVIQFGHEEELVVLRLSSLSPFHGSEILGFGLLNFFFLEFFS